MAQSIEIENLNTVLFVNEERKRKTIANFISTYFNIGYYFGMTPFRLKDRGGRPVIITWWFPKIAWSVILVPCILFRVAESRDILQEFDSEWWNPAAYFRVLHAISKLSFHIVLYYYLGFESGRYLSIVKFIYESPNLPVPQFKRFGWKILVPSTCIIFLVFGILLGPTFLGRFLDCQVDGKMEDNIRRMLQFCVNWGKYCTFMTNERVRCEKILPVVLNKSLSYADFVIGILTGLGSLLRHISGFYEELYIQIGVLVFWHCSREFANRLRHLLPLCNARNKKSRVWEPALTWYSSLKELSELIKDAYGNILLQRMILMIFDIPISFEYRSDTADQIRFVLLFMSSALLYILAADASNQIKTFETWISHVVELNLPGISHQQLSVLLHELQANTVGISTTAGFTITFSFVANVSGIIITYFIICVQYSTTTLSNVNKN